MATSAMALDVFFCFASDSVGVLFWVLFGVSETSSVEEAFPA